MHVRRPGGPPSTGRRRGGVGAPLGRSSRHGTARPGWTLVEAARLVDRRSVRHLPVTDRHGRLVGILIRRGG
ncbi:CBS domain-containing protein [Kitasatospora sp. NPDC054795]